MELFTHIQQKYIFGDLYTLVAKTNSSIQSRTLVVHKIIVKNGTGTIVLSFSVRIILFSSRETTVI